MLLRACGTQRFESVIPKVGLFSFQNINSIGNNFNGITFIINLNTDIFILTETKLDTSFRCSKFMFECVYVRVYLNCFVMTFIRETDRETLENLIKNSKFFKAKKQLLYRFSIDKWKVFFHQTELTRNWCY